MTTLRVNVGSVAPALKREIIARLQASRLDQLLVSFAKRRIDNGGDSEHKYPELWATRLGLGYRAGGQPLRDTSVLYNGLHGDSAPTSTGVRIRLRDGTGYGRKHQDGFINKAPVFIALTRKAARTTIVATILAAMKMEAKLKGLVEGTDFMILKHDAKVPARKIYNTPPEDMQDLAAALGSR